MKNLLYVIAAGSLCGACSWSSFDDLGSSTWVDSTGAADGVSTDTFLGVAAPGQSSNNSTFVVLGRATNSIGAYVYDADGARTTQGAEISGQPTDFGPFSPDVVVFGDPYSNLIGVASITGPNLDGDTKLVNFKADMVTAGAVTNNDFNQNAATPLDGPIAVTGAVYARTDDDGTNTTTTDAVLARGSQIAMVSDYANTNAGTLSTCLGGGDMNHTVMALGRGQFDGNADDELVASINDSTGTAPELDIFHGGAITTTWNADTSTLHACFDDGSGNLELHTIKRIPGPSGDPHWGKRVVVGDFNGDGFSDIAVSSPENNKVTVYMNAGDNANFTAVDVPAQADDAGFGESLSAGDLDSMPGDELIVGAPTSTVDGASSAGNVEVFTFSGGTATDEMTLHDIQPEAEQQLGISTAVVPWGTAGKRVLVVVGDHEVFTYFRTALYDDVRNGH